MAKAGPLPATGKPILAENAPSDQARDERYVVVARRYRPKSFDQLVGQQHVGQALCNAIETGRVGHAYLFTGARGVGKTSTARIFAKALNDPSGPNTSPDGQTDIALAIDAGEDVDVLEIDGASNRGIDEIRALRAGVGVRPSRSRYKIYIIDEVHMLTPAAFNALLKTLEEPPPHVKFIFCTTDPDKLPITVLSRCQRFDFAPVAAESILGRLREIVDTEGVEAEEEALRLIARRAEGSMRDSQSLLEQVMSFSDGKLTSEAVHTMLGTADDARLHELAMAISARDSHRVLALVDQACGEGIGAGQLVEQLLGYFRDLLVVTVGCPAEMQRHAGEALHEQLQGLGRQWGLQTVLGMIGLLDQTLVRIRHSLHGRVLLESSLVQLCHFPDLQAVSDLASSLAGSGLAVSKAGPSTAARPDTSPPGGEQKKNAESLKPVVTAGGSRLPAGQASQMSTAASPAPREPAVERSPPRTEAAAEAIRHAAHPEQTPPPAKSRVQLMREIEQNPYVRRCAEIFGAEIIKVDPAR